MRVVMKIRGVFLLLAGGVLYPAAMVGQTPQTQTGQTAVSQAGQTAKELTPEGAVDLRFISDLQALRMGSGWRLW